MWIAWKKLQPDTISHQFHGFGIECEGRDRNIQYVVSRIALLWGKMKMKNLL
jgi:hypothetical protein